MFALVVLHFLSFWYLQRSNTESWLAMSTLIPDASRREEAHERGPEIGGSGGEEGLGFRAEVLGF